jgi:hypothetical protein
VIYTTCGSGDRRGGKAPRRNETEVVWACLGDRVAAATLFDQLESWAGASKPLREA